jgi:alcohol dehydrogenase (NADP+)
METLVRPQFGTRFIGISNFSPKQVEDILKVARIKPKVHQIELHPYLQQDEFVETNLKHGINVIAYSPLANTNPVYGALGRRAPAVLENPVIKDIAKARGCTPAQVVLGWNMNRKVIVIPKAAQSHHQKENIATIEKCNMTTEDFGRIKTLGVSLRMSAVVCKPFNYECFRGLKGDVSG